MSVKSLFQACAGVAVALMGARLPAATRVVDKFHGPYYTIQAAVEAAEAGETVFVRNGIHDVGGALDGFSTPMSNRVYVAKSLTLVGESKEGAIIKGAHATEEVDDKGLGCGANAVRCLGINADNVVVSNLTLTGGATHNTTAGNDKEENNGDDFHGGGVLAEYGTAATLATVTDCVISNCVARRGGGGFFGIYNRVRFLDNRVLQGGNGPAVRGNGANNCFLVNCVIDRNEGYATVYFPTLLNCTFGADNTQNGNKDGVSVIRESGDVRNCLFLGKNSAIGKADAAGEVTATRFYDCVFSMEMKAYLDKQAAKTDGSKVFVDASCTATAELAVADDLTPVVGANAAVDAANADGYDAAMWGELDVYGNPRRVNGLRLDVGAVEADWKAAYTEAIECRFQVTAADPAVELVADGVLIPAGASLAATVGRAGVANGAYVLRATVNGKACAVTQDGAAAHALVQGANEARIRTGATGLTDLVFTADASGSTVIAALKAASCMFMILR